MTAMGYSVLSHLDTREVGSGARWRDLDDRGRATARHARMLPSTKISAHYFQ